MVEVNKNRTEYWTHKHTPKEKYKRSRSGSDNLNFNEHNKATVVSSKNMVGWIWRTFKTSGKTDDDTLQHLLYTPD